MIADETAIGIEAPSRAGGAWRATLSHLWACWWWTLRVHVAASHGIPRSALSPPPAYWLASLAASSLPLPRRRGRADPD